MWEPRAERIKVVYFSPDIVQNWMIEGQVMPSRSVRCVRGIPQDAVFLRGFYDGQRNMFGAVFSHPSWAPVQEGREIPLIDVHLSAFGGADEA